MKRYSKQREVIIKLLKNRTDHPTADMLYMDLKKELPDIGIATVYRNLSDLYQEGEILKIKPENGGPDRYDGNIEPHIHFECEKCGNVYDIFPEDKLYSSLNDNMKKLAKLIYAQITDSNIKIRGICENCKK